MAEGPGAHEPGDPEAAGGQRQDAADAPLRPVRLRRDGARPLTVMGARLFDFAVEARIPMNTAGDQADAPQKARLRVRLIAYITPDRSVALGGAVECDQRQLLMPRFSAVLATQPDDVERFLRDLLPISGPGQGAADADPNGMRDVLLRLRTALVQRARMGAWLGAGLGTGQTEH